jgi:hypothetical protein
MMNMRRWGLVALALSHVTCHQVILTAPPGSTMTLFANPEFIAAHGDVSVITAFLMEANGTPVADGTVVQFFTNLGKIQEQAKTNDGVARVNLISDSRSGTATVSAFSGGGTGGGGGTTTTTTTLTTGPNRGPAGIGTSGKSVAAGSSLGAVAASASVDVIIGSARPARVVVTANPSRLTSSRSTEIVANVFDENGNPIANVPVIFSVSATGRTSTETMDSGGAPIFTDTNGRASDVMRTRYSRDAVPTTATVTATLPNGISNSVIVVIN